MNGGLRVALFGGTFDPPHRGHVAIARAAADHLSLQTVLFAPVAQQPLKRGGGTADFSHRLSMAALLSGEDPRFAVSNLDGPRPDGQPNYTVWTLELLHRLMPQSRLFNLVGADSFRHLGSWRNPVRLLELAEWIVVSRPGSPLAEPLGMILSEDQRRCVHLLDCVQDDVSATELRERLQRGVAVDELIPEGVARYIAEHGLYRGHDLVVQSPGDSAIPQKD